MPPLSLRTLGAFSLDRLTGDGARDPILPPGKPLALVTYLALAPRRTASRAMLVDLLWANADPDRARQTLRQTLSQLRALLGDGCLTGHGHDLTLAGDVATDRDAFLDAVRASDLERCVALYAGHFLADFAVPGGGGFERWAAGAGAERDGAARRPYRLAFDVTPLSGGEGIGLVPAPVIRIEDERGMLVSGAADSVRIAVVGDSDQLRGTTVVAAVHGLARFSDLRLGAITKPMTVRFTARGLLPVQTVIDPNSDTSSTLRLESAVLNGERLAPAARRLVVHAGDSITGTVRFRYTSAWPAASVILGAVPTWGDRRRDFVTISALPTPSRDVTLQTAVAVAPPRRAGCYHLVFAFQAEGNVEQIASATNWTVGHPIWGDGNDVAGWSDDQLREANRVGAVRSTLVYREGGRLRTKTYWVPATVIEVAARGRGSRADPCAAPGARAAVR